VNERHGDLLVLGWREWVRLPGLRIPSIKAKLDTGARSSALHVVSYETFTRGKREQVRFAVDPNPKKPDYVVEVELPVIEQRLVRSSLGEEDLRIVVRTNLEINGRAWPIDLTLARRDRMRFRMLIGREALSGRALVDPTRSYLGDHPARRAPIDYDEEKAEEE